MASERGSVSGKGGRELVSSSLKLTTLFLGHALVLAYCAPGSHSCLYMSKKFEEMAQRTIFKVSAGRHCSACEQSTVCVILRRVGEV